ncbi:Linear gramicidin synthase subunit [Dirofilaria immitis]
MASKYDSEDMQKNIANIAEERGDHCKISTKAINYDDQKKNEIDNEKNKSENLKTGKEQNDFEESNRSKEELESKNNTNVRNQNQKFENSRELKRIEGSEALPIPGLLINIREQCISAISSFQALSDIFQEYYAYCCNAFHICPGNLSTETPEECAAMTYAIIRLLLHIGYIPERIVVSGLDTLMMLAAKDAMKLDDACFAWKTIASLMKDSGDDSMIVEQINATLSKLDINFQKTTSLINIRQLALSDIESLIIAILTSDKQNQQFFDSRMESYMILGFEVNKCSMKHIEKHDDFVSFITSQNDSKLLEAFQKTLTEKKNMPKNQLFSKNQPYQLKNSNLNQVINKIFNVKISMKEEKYLFDHLIHNYNILSAATLLIIIYDALSKKVNILNDVTFLFPITFTSENEIINFQIQISTNALCTLTYANLQCVTFQVGECCLEMHSECDNNNWQCQNIHRDITIANTGSEQNLKSISKREFYTLMEQYHYQYCQEFRCIENLIINGENGTVELKPTEHLDILIDGAMQAIVFIYIQQYGIKLSTLVPFHIQKMKIVDIANEAIPIGKHNNTNILAFVKIELQNERFLGSFEFATDKIAITAYAISFYPMMLDNIKKSLKNERILSSNDNIKKSLKKERILSSNDNIKKSLKKERILSSNDNIKKSLKNERILPSNDNITKSLKNERILSSNDDITKSLKNERILSSKDDITKSLKKERILSSNDNIKKSLKNERILSSNDNIKKSLKNERILPSNDNITKSLKNERILSSNDDITKSLKNERILSSNDNIKKSLKNERILSSKDDITKSLKKERILSSNDNIKKSLKNERILPSNDNITKSLKNERILSSNDDITKSLKNERILPSNDNITKSLKNERILSSNDDITKSLKNERILPSNDNITKSLKNERILSSNLLKSQTDSLHDASIIKSGMNESMNKNDLSQMAVNKLTLKDEKIVCIKSFACRLPKNIHNPAEFWDALKTGQIMASKIPCSRISGRDSLAQGQYGHPVRCANFLANDIAHFDAAFFDISRSEAEKIDPQQRILLECVYECMENAGLTSLKDTGFFIGFMSNEYPDIAKSRDAISMLGSSASIVSGRLNYLFGSTGPSITLDTACSSSLVALQAAIHALFAGQCTMAIVAGVNLILTEQSIGQRANGNLLSDDGICRSFDARSSGYGRADGCVALLLTITDKMIESDNDSALLSIISTCIGHNGQGMALTVPNGCAQEKLLRECLSKLTSSQSVNYWEAHGTGTIIGDAIELKALQANLQQCLIGTVKTNFGHSEAAAGATGLAKILLQFKYEYIPQHGSYQFLQNLQNGNLYLPIIGEEWNDTLAGISSFGISGTNAMILLQSKKITHKQFQTITTTTTTTKWQTYICPISAKNMHSLKMLMISYQTMFENTFQKLDDICAIASLQRNHMQYRAIILLHKRRIIQKWWNFEMHKNDEMIGLKLYSNSFQYILPLLYSTFTKFKMNFKIYLRLVTNFAKQQNFKKIQQIENIIILTSFLSLITFLNDIGIKVKAIYAYDNLSLIAALLITGKLKFAEINDIAYLNMQIFTNKISTTNNYADKYKWYKLCTIKDWNIFEYELMKMIATFYLQGKCINWAHLYSLPSQLITLPNYQFKHESYWITENQQSTIDHWLIGRLLEEEEDRCIFINQISKMTNAELMNFKYDGQIRFTFGICCEAIIQAFQLTFSKNIIDESQYYSIKNITMIKYIVQENDWIKITITKYADKRYHAKITCTSDIICEAKIKLIASIATMKATNIIETENFNTKTNFYEILNDKGLSYEGIYQTIINASSNEKIFVAKCCYHIFLIIETIIQTACYRNILNPSDIYGEKKFIIENLNFHASFSQSIYIWIENRKIFVYDEANNRMIISATLANKKVQKKVDKMKYRKKVDEAKLDQFINSSSIAYQQYIDKIRQAVEDIRKDDNAISNEQLSTSFAELGLDSLAITDLANRLNTNYFPGLRITAVDLFNYSNIRLLTDAIYTHKISSIITDNKDGEMSRIMEERSDVINTTLKQYTNREFQNHDTYKYIRGRSGSQDSISMINEDESCAYSQIFFNEQQSINDYKTVIITDRKFISSMIKKKSNNELIIVVSNKIQQRHSIQDDAGILYINIKNPEYFTNSFSSYLNGHKTIMVKFELSSNFPLRYLIEALLHFTKAIIKSRQTYIFSNMPGNGKANAFALGYAKSLSAELYPKIRYEWNFILQKISNLKNLSKSSHMNEENSKERWLITGGLGGIGWQMAIFIAYNRKISHLILLGRKQPNEAQNREIHKIRDSLGVDVRAVSVDLTSKMEMKKFFEKLQITLTSIIHSAGCLHDALASKQNLSTFRLVTEAKCDGLLILEKLCHSHPIKHFIVNSSVSAIIGNRGQCNYSAANAFIDEIMLERRAKKLPATIINWGNWSEIGMAVRANKILNKMGFIGLKTKNAMIYLQIAIDYAPIRLIVIQLDIEKVLHYRPDLTVVFQNNTNEKNMLKTRKSISGQISNQRNQKYKRQHTDDILKQWNKNVRTNNRICKNKIRANDTNDEDNLHYLKSKIAEILQELTGEVITIEDYQRSFMDLGLDSLKIYRFVNGLTDRIKIEPSLNVLTIFEHPTIEQLSHYIGSLFYHIKEHSEEIIITDNNFLSKHEENFENIAKNFVMFVLHSKNKEKLEKKKRHLLKLFDQSSKIFEILSDRSLAYDHSSDYLHIVWGLKYKTLRNNLLHSEIISNIKQSREKPIVCFMISGQGSQVWNMGRQLSCIFPFFRKKFNETLDAANRYMPKKCVNIRDIIYQWHYRELLYHTEYAQPIIYCFAYSLAKFYEFCGVQANFFVGHSVGEIVACTLADRITLDDALKLVIRRGQILRFIKGKGKMIAVKKNDAEKFQRYSGMDRAAENSDKQIVLSGDNHSARLCSHFARLYQYSITVIDDCYPFHSSIIHDTLLHEYAMECKKVRVKKTKTRNVVSTCTGQFMDSETELIASINSTVFFSECVKTLNNNGTNIWLEIGNGEILSTFVRSMLGFNLSNMLICSSIKSDKQEVDSFIHSLCEIQNLGIKIKWDRICDKTDIDNVQEITKIYQEKTEKKLMIGKEKYMELIEQHLIYDEIILPAAFIIAMFTEFIINSSETCTSKLKMQQRNRRGRSASILERGRSSIECERSSIERETIIFEALRLERRINENDLSKLQIKFNSSELILTDGINKYSTCRISNKEYLEQMKHINILNKLRIDYKQLKIRINELSHEAFYETMRKRGLQYGLKYQILREIYRKRRYIVATLINADNLTIILDGALQLLSAALLTDNKSIIYIPFAIDNIMIKYDMKTTCNHFQAYGIITECTDNIIKGSVIIYEGDDAMIILHNVTAIDISTNKFITSIKPDNHSDSRYLVNRKMKNYSSNKDKNDNVRNINTDNTSITTGIKKDENSPVLNETLQIEIISYVGQFPGSAVDCASLWNNLKSGESYHLSGNIQRLQADITTFNPVQFGITPKEAAYIDPQQRILLELAEKIVEKIGAERLNNETGVFIGVSSNDFAQKAYQEIQHTCSYLSTGTNQSVLAGRIAYWFNLNGPTMVIDTACSSFFSALAVACDNIKMGNCRAALVGAVNIILNSKPTSVLENAQMLSKTGFCKVFDADADGYVRSEGAAMILIQGVNEKSYNSKNETLISYRDEMKFTIESYGIAHNGRSNGLTVPNSISEYELINRVSRKCANISTISWVEAHATGTPLGDPIEMKAIIKALADTSCSDHSIHITSVKSSLGHCEAMAGAASLIMALEAYHHRYLPSIQHFKLLNTNIINNSSLVVPVIGEELPDTFEMLINSFGFSGTNVSIVLRGSSRREMRENVKVSNHLITKQRLLSFDHSPCILLCSANDSGSFNLASEKLEEYLKRTNQNLATVCACLQNLRNTGRYRIAIPIKRHTQQLTFSGISAKPEKWMKIAFNMGKSPEPAMIAELFIIYRSFRQIFMKYFKTYKCTKSIFISSKLDEKLTFEYISKLSVITFLFSIGINPSAIIVSNRIDRIIAKVIRRKYRMKNELKIVNDSNKQILPEQCNFEILHEMILDDFDCIIKVQNLQIEKSKTICDTNWKRLFIDQFMDTICQLYEHFIDINWQMLNDRISSKRCLIPEPEYSKKKYWPFADCNMQNDDYNFTNDEILISDLQPEMPQEMKELDKSNSMIVDHLTNNIFDNVEMESINHHQYLYKLVQKKCILSDPKQATPFIAINLIDTTTIIAQQAIAIVKINDNNDITKIKEQINLHKCTKLVLEWIIDDENLLESTIKQNENFFNEIIYYNNGNRYVERLQRMNDTELIIKQIRNLKRILITGNIRGIAIELIKMLKPHLAIVVSRSMPNECYNDENDIVIKTIQADCTDYEQMKKIIATFAPFDVIFHCAATINNSLMENMNVKLFEMVCHPKIIGLQNIIKLSKIYQIRKIVAFSSAATILGSAGQANYVVANELLEYMMRRDMPEGLFISWGPWDGRGLLIGKHLTGIRKQIQNSGWKLLQAKQVAQLCSKLLSNTGYHIIMDVNFDVIRKKRPYLKNFLENISDIDIDRDDFIIQDDLHSNPKSVKDFSEIIMNCITEVSGITDVKPDIGFMSMGIDSLMIAEMQELLNERLNLNISVAIFYEYSTVETLSQYIAQNILAKYKLHDDVKIKDIDDEVAIIGYSGAFSGATDDATFWTSLLDGKELIERQERTTNDNQEIIEAIGMVPNIDKFDYRFWKMSPDDATYIDPQIRKFVEHAYIALERSGLIRFRNKLRIAVIVGAEPSEYRPKSRRIGGIEDLYEMNQKDFVAAWTSHLLDLRGPSFGVYSACSTALVAIIQARNLLRENQCDIALAGAVSLAIPHTEDSDNIVKGMVLSSDGHCRPFDHQSSGTVRGSGVGVVVLQRIREIQQTNTPMIAKIIGYGISNDGLIKSSFMAPNISGQYECMKQAIEMAGTTEMDYIECHGTGTTTGDLIEFTAMSQLYHRDTLIGSVKANIGHALAAAGIGSIIKLCKIAEMRIIPKQINFDKLNENLNDVSFNIIQSNVKIPKEKLRFAVNASGIGGTNAHIIMENDNRLYHLSSYQQTIKQYFYALTISAQTENACIQLCNRIADYLKSEMNLAQIASTLQNYREHFQYRIGFSSQSIIDTIDQLKNIDKLKKIIKLKSKNIAFYFSPQGLEYSNIGLKAIAYNEVFYKVLQKCCHIASKLIGMNFQTIILHPQQQFNMLQQMIIEQPYSQMAIFIVCFALAEQLRSWNIDAYQMIGHSLGEYVAAAQANVFDVETALKILFKRGCLIAKTEKAKMLAVRYTKFASELMTKNSGNLKIPENIEISAILRSDLGCLIGKPETIDKLKEKLEEDKIYYRELITNYGFHSSFMDSILEEFAHFLKNFTFRKPTRQILSNIDGQLITHFDSKYMVEHMRSTIRIDKCIKNLHSDIKVIIEIGPKGIVESLLKDDSREIEVISTLPSRKQYEKGYDTGDLLNIATKLWLKGYELNWEKICGNYGFDRLLPNYQFEKDICWENDQIKKWNMEKFEINLYEPYWIPYKFSTTHKRLPKGVLLFLPMIFTKSINTLLTMLHNLFIPIQCIFDDISSSKNFTIKNGNIYINSNKQESYQQLANFLRNINFPYDTIIHAWNLPENDDIASVNDSFLFSSFYSVYWVLTHIIQNMTADLRFLVCIDCNSQPEIFTILGPIREIAMTRQLTQAACILCTSEVNLFETLQLLETLQADFSLIRNSVNGEFEHFSYQLKSIRNDDYFMKNQNQSIIRNDCLVRDRDIVVIFGFGNIGQSFINVLCQNFDFLTIYVASPNATCHFQNFQTKINRWKTSRKYRMSRNTDSTNVCWQSDKHTIVAYDVDITKENEVQHFLMQIISQHGCINIIIHAAARKIDNIKFFDKSFDEMQFVLEPKIRGIRNIINILYQNNIIIRSLILNSSMNGLFGLPGNNDYAASNNFLDACCKRNFQNIQNITTIQWAGWKDSNMLNYYSKIENRSQNPVANLIIKYSLSVQEAERMIWKCLHEQGLIAISIANPNDIARKIYQLNFTSNHKCDAIIIGEEEKNSNNLTNIIGKIWMNNLGVERITDEDDFFQLGGHSLNGMQIIWEINRIMQINCKLDDLFKNSIFQHFLQFLQQLAIEENHQKFSHNLLKNYQIFDTIGKLSNIPLSYSQENMYILRQLHHPTLYNICFLLTFQGLLCTKSLQKALLFLIARQTSLRTAFSISNDECYQEIYSLTESYYHITWPNMNDIDRHKLIEDEKNHTMDLSMIPFRILSMCNKKSDMNEIEYMIIISQHHIITDGWSMTIFANELGQFYHYCVTKQPIPETFKRLSRNVTHFAIWQRSSEFTDTIENDLQRLSAKLQGLQATQIIAQKTATSTSKLISQKTFSIPMPLWAQIIQTAKQYQQTLYTVMLTAFLCLIRKFSDDYSNNTIVIGCPVAGRTVSEEMKSVIGYFLNNIILIIKDLKINVSNSILFKQVKDAIQDARSFEHIPFHLLVAKLIHQRRYIHQHPFFNLFFNYRHNLDFPKIEIFNVKSTITQLTTNDAFDFAWTIDETDSETLITIDYNSNHYSAQVIEEMIRVYLKLLKSITSPADSVEIEMNNLGCRIYRDILSGSAIDIILQQSMLTDKLNAFCYSHQIITYQQMYDMIHIFSKQIKQFYLQNNCRSIRADTIIPICANSNAIILPLLAVQLIGAAYAPIDPENSITIIAQLLQDIGATIVISQENNLSLDIPTLSLIHSSSSSSSSSSSNNQQSYIHDIEGLEMNHLKEKFEKRSIRKYSQNCDASYIIFTSGSTGKPKAICVTNQNLINFIFASTQQAIFRPKYYIYHSVNTIFDVSCMNIFTTFSNGSCLISSKNILNATAEIVEKKVQFAFLSSALFNMLNDNEINQLQQLENLYVGGETPNNEQLNRCLQIGIRIRQIYGPTETTIWSLTNNCSLFEYECGRIIGIPIDNVNVYLLDSENNMTHDGSKGELVICGKGVTRGYLNQKTDVFTFNKFHTKEDEILNYNTSCYHTGDFAMKNGKKYHFMGRKDKQLKIRGYRIEPIEIEIIVRRWNSTIKNVAVLKNDQLDNLFLFIETDNNDRYCFEELRQYLKEHLLHFMIPKKIITLQRMPLNRNGKIDINKLKEMMKNDYSIDKNNPISSSIPTNGKLCESVMKIWCQLLGISDIKLEDNFFTLGGHSLLLVHLRHKLYDKLKFELNFEQFYRQPTLAALIDTIHTNMNMQNKITKVVEQSNYYVDKPVDKHDNMFDQVYQHHTTLLSSPTAYSIHEIRSIKFVNLREAVSSAIGNLYMIHAIAGTIYPYFGLVSAIPQCLNIYAIEYEFYYPSNSLMELATFYAKNIAKHCQIKPIYLMGHSLGGILAREIAQLLYDNDNNNDVSFVIMFDSWCIGIDNLHLDTIKCYLQEKFEGLPGKQEYIDKSAKLAEILQKHQFSINSIKIYLLKAKNHGNSPLRTNLKGSDSKEQIRWSISNGWQKISTKNVDIFLLDGDHDSMLQQHNITLLTRIFAYIYAKNGLTIEQI